jgi:hypothetical protein
MDYSKEVHLKFYFDRRLYTDRCLVELVKKLPEFGLVVEIVHEESEVPYNQFVKDENRIITSFNKSNLIIDFTNLNGALFLSKVEHEGVKLIGVTFVFFMDEMVKVKVITYLINLPGLYYGWLGNGYDIKWQEETNIQAYKVNEKSIRDLFFTTDFFGDKVVDVSKNYGCTILKGAILFNAAYCMWFGKSLVDEYSLSKIKEFKELIYVMEYDTGVVEARLFSKLLGDYSNNRVVQKRFLDYFNLSSPSMSVAPNKK